MIKIGLNSLLKNVFQKCVSLIIFSTNLPKLYVVGVPHCSLVVAALDLPGVNTVS